MFLRVLYAVFFQVRSFRSFAISYYLVEPGTGYELTNKHPQLCIIQALRFLEQWNLCTH